MVEHRCPIDNKLLFKSYVVSGETCNWYCIEIKCRHDHEIYSHKVCIGKTYETNNINIIGCST